MLLVATQWISPQFAIQVSLMDQTIIHWRKGKERKGKVEVNLKVLKEKENIIKNCNQRIKLLENMVLMLI